MKLRYMLNPVLAISMALIAGCSGPADVQAVAPAHQSDLSSAAPEGGRYAVYRAIGFDQDNSPTIEKLYSVYVPKGQRMGFRWVTDAQREWAPQGALHLEAFAAGDVRDLGPFNNRDMKYVWAADNADVAGYFSHANSERTGRILTLQ